MPKESDITNKITEAAQKHNKTQNGASSSKPKDKKQPFMLSEQPADGTDRDFVSSNSVNTWIDLLGAVPDPESVILESSLVGASIHGPLNLFLAPASIMNLFFTLCRTS
jgi:hypothetical protein